MSKQNDDIIEKVHARFSNDCTGFSKAFTSIFTEQDGSPQTPHKKQIEFMNLIKPNEKIVTVVKCRQSGLSTAIQAKSVHRAFFGKVPEILITSAGLNQSMRVLKKIKTFFDSMPEFMQVEYLKNTETQIQLANGTSVYSLPANADTCRGFTGDVFLDEYGVLNRRESEALWEALLPCTIKGYELSTASTPKGTDNMFYDLCSPKKDPETGLYKGPVADKVIRIHWSDVPHVAAVVDRFRKSMHPRQFAQEFECVFVDDVSDSMFTLDFILDHFIDNSENPIELIDTDPVNHFGSEIIGKEQRLEYLKEIYPKGIHLGWDIAIQGDGSICCVFGIDENDVWNLISYKKFEQGTNLTDQVSFVALMAQYFCAKKLCFDATAALGLTAKDLLERTVIKDILHPFIFSQKSKAEEYSAIRIKMESEGMRAPKIDDMIKEFTLLHYNPVTGTIAATGNKHKNHDDWPSAVLCAYAGRKKSKVDCGFFLI